MLELLAAYALLCSAASFWASKPPSELASMQSLIEECELS